MNGMNNTGLQQLPSASELLKVDPLQFINDEFKQQAGLLESKFAESHANLTRDSDNNLRILDREYQTREEVLKRKYMSVPEAQRDEEYFQKMWREYDNLVGNYRIQQNKIRGKIQPDLDDWEASRGLMMQRLEADRNEKIRQIQNIQQLYDEDVITDDASAQAKIYSIATGMNLSASFFKQPDPFLKALELAAAAVDLREQGQYEQAAAVDNQKDQLLSQLHPDAAKTVESATRFTGLEGRQKARQARREKERTGTMAEGITQAKNQAKTFVKTLDANMARAILVEAGGDKNKARQIARQRGYKF